MISPVFRVNIATIWVPTNLILQSMAWCHQAASPYLSQCWPGSVRPYVISRPQWFNSLGPSDAIWWHRSGSTLVQVMACCLMAPNHYLNQCWLIISKVLRHSPEGNFIRDTSATIHWNWLKNSKIWNLKLNWNLPGANELMDLLLGMDTFLSHMLSTSIRKCIPHITLQNIPINYVNQLHWCLFIQFVLPFLFAHDNGAQYSMKGLHWIYLVTNPSGSFCPCHYSDIIMGTIAYQVTSLTIVYSTVYLGTDQRKHQSPMSMAFMQGFQRGMTSDVEMFSFYDVIMC